MKLPTLVIVLGSASGLLAQPADDLSRQVREAQTAFEKTMARRDWAAFQTWLAPDAVFLPADGQPALRGRAAVAEAWRPFFAGPQAPFSWEAEAVHVIPSGTLALAIGPVRDAAGRQIRTFNSVWRSGPIGRWQLVLDYACPACNCAPTRTQPEGVAGEVWRSEVAFAKTMADRDHAAFRTHLAEDAIFMGRSPLRGRDAVAQGWRNFYEGAAAPFSWAPDRVLLLESSSLAVSQGPVIDPSGKRASTFTSVWRKEPDGRWRVVLDKGCDACQCK